jgi:hypothetical protein
VLNTRLNPSDRFHHVYALKCRPAPAAVKGKEVMGQDEHIGRTCRAYFTTSNKNWDVCYESLHTLKDAMQAGGATGIGGGKAAEIKELKSRERKFRQAKKALGAIVSVAQQRGKELMQRDGRKGLLWRAYRMQEHWRGSYFTQGILTSYCMKVLRMGRVVHILLQKLP